MGIYKLQEQSFTHEDVYKNKTPLLKKLTNTSFFIFNQKVVDEFRMQLGNLCDNLYSVFHYNKVPSPSSGAKRSSRQKNKSESAQLLKCAAYDPATELLFDSPIIDLCTKRTTATNELHDKSTTKTEIPAFNLHEEVTAINTGNNNSSTAAEITAIDEGNNKSSTTIEIPQSVAEVSSLQQQPS